MTSSAAQLKNLFFLGLLSLALLGGCASTNNPRDPLEPLNRAIYSFNDGLDRALIKPVATVYQQVLPQFVRTGVTNFFNNIYDVITALNNLLQGKIAEGVSDVGRLAVNTTIGIAGLIDVATEIGLEKHKEDFGQTLGLWGFGPGPYLQIPFFGPSSFRDAIGLFVDVRGDPVRWIWRDDVAVRNSLWGLYLVNLRANLLDSTRILDEAALDPYEFQRDAYMQRRRNLVYDGNPPPQKEDDEELPELKTKPRTETDRPAGPSGAALEAPRDSILEASPAESRPQLPADETAAAGTPLPAASAAPEAVPAI